MLFALYGTPLFILVRILYNGVTLPANNFNDVLYCSRGLKVTRRLSEDELNIVVDSMLTNLNSRYPHYSYRIDRERKNIVEVYHQGDQVANALLRKINTKFAEWDRLPSHSAETLASQKPSSALQDVFTFVIEHPQFTTTVAVVSTMLAFGLFLMHCSSTSHEMVLKLYSHPEYG